MRRWLPLVGLFLLTLLAACSATTDTEAEIEETTSEINGSGAKYPVRASLRREIAERLASERLPTPAYFFVGFGYEGSEKLASQSHTFASFVRVDGDGEQTWSTISWLPKTFAADQTICIFEDLGDAAKQKLFGNPCEPVVARNYDLTKTVGWAVAADRKLGIWGPYRIKRELYDLGKARVDFLESGAVSYMADDGDTRKKGEAGAAFNCMHAVSDLRGHFYPQTFFDRFAYGNWGIRGTRYVMEHYASALGDGFYDPVDPNRFRTFAN